MASVYFAFLPLVGGCLLGIATDSAILAIGLTAGKANKQIIVPATLGGVHGVGAMALLLTWIRCRKDAGQPIPGHVPMLCGCLGFTLVGIIFIVPTVLALVVA